MFSNRLKQLRKQYNMTQAELAKALNIGTSTIAMYENNIRKPSYKMLLKMADFFDVSIDYMAGEKEDFQTIDGVTNIVNILSKLDTDEQQQIIDFIQFIANKKRKSKN